MPHVLHTIWVDRQEPTNPDTLWIRPMKKGQYGVYVYDVLGWTLITAEFKGTIGEFVVSQLPEATPESNGVMSAADKAKLDALGIYYGSTDAVGEVCMRHLWCLPTTAPTASGTNAFSNIQSNAIFYVPYGSLSSYQGANYWSAYAPQMVEAGKITYSLSHVERSNQTPMVAANSSYTTTLTAETGYSLGTVTVTMGGVNITSSVYSDGVVSIPSVTGNIVITATGIAS